MSRLSALFTLFLSVFIISNISAFEYSIDSPDIRTAFEKAGDNAPELQKVIDHYQKAGDNQKLTATYFLIANMEQHSHATYRWFDTSGVDVTFDVLAYPNYDSLIVKIGQIEKERGELDYEKSELIYDLQHITADFLINQIDYAFLAWQEKPWAKNFDFTLFCRYILPYRGSNEPLEEWRKYFYDKYAHITKYMEDENNPLEAASIINDDIKTWFGFDPRFYLHPTDQGLSEMIDNKLGRCEDMTNITIYAMRANGLAVTSDYTPYWANSGNNHAWNAIVTAEGNVIPFMGAEASPGNYKLSGKVGKVYRKTYDQQKDNLVFQVPEGTEIPRWLKGKNYMDVTADYTDVADVEIVIFDAIDGKGKNINMLGYTDRENVLDRNIKVFTWSPPDSVDVVYICVFNSGEWKPIHWSLIKNRYANFHDMGTDILYLPVYYINKEIVSASHPIILQNDGRLRLLSINKENSKDLTLHSTTRRKLVMSTDGVTKAHFKTDTVYELFFWSDEWQSLGTQTAIDDKPLTFENVPTGGLYWLVAEGSDKEERIFTIDKDGNQVWW